MATEKITEADVRHVAKLARLDLTDDEVELFTGQLAAVLEHAEDVEALDTAGVPPTAHPLPLVNVLREDVPRDGVDRDEVLAHGAGRRGRPLPRAAHPRRGALMRRSEMPLRSRAGSLALLAPACVSAVCVSVRSDIAAAVRSGDRSARSVVDEHLATIEAREGEIHAFNLVLADEARAAADELDRRIDGRRGPGPAGRRPDRPQGQPLHARHPDDVLVPDPRGLAPAVRRHRRRAAARRRRHPDRQDQPRRVRHGLVHRELAPSGRPATRTTPTRVPGGSSGGSAAAVAAGFAPLGARLRHRRLDPPARGAVRRRRA